MAIYTKRGDRGRTSLYDAKNSQEIRTSKDSLRISAIGAIDELNSFLGIVSSQTENQALKEEITEIQKELFTIGSILAGAKVKLQSYKVTKLEEEIDKLEGELPVLKNFILPGGTDDAAQLQYARALCRRAERNLVALSKLQTISSELLSYMNRLSDYLFMLAREANFKAGFKEEIWKRKT